MIHKRAIEEFLNQQLDDFTWMKKLPEKEIDQAISELVPRPYFDREPLDLHQKVSFLLGLAYPGFYLQLDMGLGKTRVALELFKYRYEMGEIHRGLFLVPTDTVAKSWRDEIAKWMPHVPKLILLDMSTTEKWQLLDQFESGIIVVTYAAFLWMVTELEAQKGKRKKKLMLQGRLIRKVVKLFQSMTLDEATKLSTKDSAIHVALRNMAKDVPFRVLMAGRPFGKDPVDTWSQYYIVDRGATLGETLGLFREAFYIAKSKFNPQGKGFWHSRMKYAMDYKLNPAREELLSRFLGNRSIYYSAEEAITLPPQVPVKKYCDMPDQQRTYWDGILKRIKQSYAAAKRGEGEIERENTFLRMRQLSSGFLGIKDEDDGKIEITFKENPKLLLLLDVLDEMPEGAQALVCTEFNTTGRLIHEALTKLKVPHGWVYGGTSSKQYDDIKHRLDTEPGYHLVGGWKKMGIGINAQAASYVIFFETPTNPLDREQFIRRALRKGSEKLHKRIFVVDLIMRDTKDEPILDAIAEGDDLHTRLLKTPRLLIDDDQVRSDAAHADGRVERGARPLASRKRPRSPSTRKGAVPTARARLQGSDRSSLR
jgi:SNF2 family DNA or RNA helicase